MRSDPSARPDSVRPGPKSQRARILMPIALAVAALVIFMVLFWPAGHGKKGSRGHSGYGSGDGRSGSSATRNSSSPVGGDSRKRSSSGKEGGWWYEDKPAKPEKAEKAGDGWWYQEESGGSGSKKGAGKDSRSPVGGQ